MSRKLKIAAIQMDSTPAPLAERLARAADLVAEAASAGAQVIVLPEVFNTGYAYIESNYAAAESLDGQTVTWMKEQAQQQRVHLAGSLMIRDGEDIYNSALLFAPDSRLWRYDKRYPFNWESAYFREGNQITIADTDLGKLGMMICWDSAHADLWQEYAGKVDAIMIPSCPPKFQQAEIVFPDGQRVPNWLDASHFADRDIHEQAAWLNIPVVHAAGAGRFRSPLPLPLLSVMGLLGTQVSRWKYLLQVNGARLEAEYDQHTQIINARGEVVGRVTGQGDQFTLAEVELADQPPKPETDQPKMRTPGIAYFILDQFGPWFFRFVYRRGVQRNSAR